MCCSSSSNQRSVIIHHFHSLALQQQNCMFREVVFIRSPCTLPIRGMLHAHITCETQERRGGRVVGGRTEGGEEEGDNREIEEEAQTHPWTSK